MYFCPILGEVISRNGVQPDPQKIKALMDMPPNNIKELQVFLGSINYLSKFSPSTTSICEPLQKLTSNRAVWIWNASYQAIYNKAKSLIKADICMKFYDEIKPLYLETDASGIGLGTTLSVTNQRLYYMPKRYCSRQHHSQAHCIFSSKSLTSVEHRCSNIEREAYGILHGLEKFHHYCFAREVSVLTDHKPLVAISRKDVTTLSQQILHILLRIHHYRVRILYKPGPEILLKIGYPDTTTRKTKMQQYMAWM